MKIFLIFVSVVLAASGAPQSSAPHGSSPYSSVQAVTTQLASSTPPSQQLRASASVQQPIYSVPASLLQQQNNNGPQQDYNSVVGDNSYSQSNPVLQSYGAPLPQQQPQQQYGQPLGGNTGQQSQQINNQQSLSYNQYSTLLENGNPPLHSTPFHVSNDFSQTTVPEGSHNNNNGEKQTVVIHKHIHMHYFVRGAELPDLPPVPEEKTFVYVLLKKPDGPPSIVFPTQVPTKPTKPEVYFIQYKDPKNKQQQHQQQQQSENIGVSPTGPDNSSTPNNAIDSSSANPPVPSSQYGARIAKSAPSS